MNNSNSSPMNEWFILLAILFFVVLAAYILARQLWKAYKFIFRAKKPIYVVDMTNVISLNQHRKRFHNE